MGLNLKALIRAEMATDTILTQGVQTWLLQHGDEALQPDVADAISTLLQTPPRFRGESFSASSAGQCPRKQVLAFLGPDGEVIDTQLQNIFNDGKWRHLRWQAMLLSARLLMHAEFPLTWYSMRSVGTMDGLGVVPDDHPRTQWRGEEFGFELKGVSSFQFPKLKKSGPLEKHRQQVDRYFLMSGMKLFVIMYEDKTTQEFKEWVIERDETRVEAQRQELSDLNQSVETRKLPPMLPACALGQGPEWADCQFGGRGGTCIRAGEWPRVNTPGFEHSKLVRVYRP